jgi:hypothetical protein
MNDGSTALKCTAGGHSGLQLGCTSSEGALRGTSDVSDSFSSVDSAVERLLQRSVLDAGIPTDDFAPCSPAASSAVASAFLQKVNQGDFNGAVSLLENTSPSAETGVHWAALWARLSDLTSLPFSPSLQAQSASLLAALDCTERCLAQYVLRPAEVLEGGHAVAEIVDDLQLLLKEAATSFALSIEARSVASRSQDGCLGIICAVLRLLGHLALTAWVCSSSQLQRIGVCPHDPEAHFIQAMQRAATALPQILSEVHTGTQQLPEAGSGETVGLSRAVMGCSLACMALSSGLGDEVGEEGCAEATACLGSEHASMAVAAWLGSSSCRHLPAPQLQAAAALASGALLGNCMTVIQEAALCTAFMFSHVFVPASDSPPALMSPTGEAESPGRMQAAVAIGSGNVSSSETVCGVNTQTPSAEGAPATGHPDLLSLCCSEMGCTQQLLLTSANIAWAQLYCHLRKKSSKQGDAAAAVQHIKSTLLDTPLDAAKPSAEVTLLVLGLVSDYVQQHGDLARAVCLPSTLHKLYESAQGSTNLLRVLFKLLSKCVASDESLAELLVQGSAPLWEAAVTCCQSTEAPIGARRWAACLIGNVLYSYPVSAGKAVIVALHKAGEESPTEVFAENILAALANALQANGRAEAASDMLDLNSQGWIVSVLGSVSAPASVVDLGSSLLARMVTNAPSHPALQSETARRAVREALSKGQSLRCKEACTMLL